MGGSVVSWLAFFMGLLMGAIGVLAVAADEQIGWAVIGVSAAAMAWGLVVNLRFSPRHVGRVLGPVLAIAGGFTVIAGFYTQPLVILWGVAALLPGVALFFYGHAGRTAQLPGVEHHAAQSALFESNGVQFALGYSGGTIPIGGSLKVQVWAQNCLDVPRTLLVTARCDSRVFAAPLTHELTLEPGVVVHASLPFRIASLAVGKPRVVIDVVGRGDTNGRRLRRVTGGEYLTPDDLALGNAMGVLSLVAGGVGTFYFGKGAGVLDLVVDTVTPYVTDAEQADRQELFRPTAEQLAEALRA